MNLRLDIGRVMKYLKTNIKYFIAFIIGIILTLCFTGSVKFTDSISAIANSIMAVAAILGLIFARQWKREATKDKVIDRCIKILSVNFFDIKNHYVSTLYINVIGVWFKSFVTNKSTSFDDVVKMKDRAGNF